MSKSPVHDYDGQQTGISWDQRLCIHASECVRAEGSLFEYGRKPWAKPDEASPEEVEDIVLRCPTGALTFRNANGENPEKASGENTVTVVYNGPLYVTGDLDIEGAPDDMPGVRFRAALCRCGKSRRKPFCDNSHLKSEFRDAGAVGKKGDNVESLSGPLSIRLARNGPLLLQGNFRIVAGSGRERFRGTKAALCRCGDSENKPFCDGTHKRNGFEAE